MDWTNDEIKRMQEMREEGLTVKAIAEALKEEYCRGWQECKEAYLFEEG